MTEIKPNYIKIMIFIKKLPEITVEEFHNYWINVHGPAAMKTLFGEKVKKYIQTHITPDLKARAEEFNIGTMGVLDFDGMAEVYVESVQDWKDLLADEGFQKWNAEDAAKFMPEDPIVMLMGYEKLVFGKPTRMEAQVNGKLVVDSEQ